MKGGRIIGLSGPTVSVDLPGLQLYERVYVGHQRLAGEVVRLERTKAVVQVYEETRGLALGEPAEGSGRPLTVRLGPGLLGGMFDGLQRPLQALRKETGPFIRSGTDPFPLDLQRSWNFSPLKSPGDSLSPGEIFGTVEEGAFVHPIRAALGGTLATIHRGAFTLDSPLATLQEGGELFAWQERPVREPRRDIVRLPTSDPLVTGQRCLDFLFPLSKGGTAIFPGGFGTGKTILEQSIAKFADVDIVIYVGCGERGNEMAEILEEFATLSDPWRETPLMERTIVVVNTSNMPVAAREASIYTAVAMGEYYRDMGYDILLLADSISRWAEALREISSSLEEMPGEEGYPTYLGSRLSAYFERAGVVACGEGTGSLSMILSVSPPGGDFTEPVTQACLRSAGALYLLDTALAHRRHFPAIHWGQSYSLYEQDLGRHFCAEVSCDWDPLRIRCRELLQKETALSEVAEIVGLEGLQDRDRLVMHAAERVRQEFLCQNAYSEDAFSTPQQTLEKISTIVAFFEEALARLEQGEDLDEILKG
jgi:V/A-type H+-transporting ATPase subunit A